MDYANTTNVEFIVGPKVLFRGWLIYRYLQIFKLIKSKRLPGECADWFFDNIMIWSYYSHRRYSGRDPFNQNSNRSDREKRTTSKGGPLFSNLFRLDRTDPLSFGPKFPEGLVEWIVPSMSRQKNRILINEHALNPEPVPLKLNQIA